MRELSARERLMATELAERHRIPKATVSHPQGVIVPGDEFMTGKLRDPDYVPYCTPCTPMQRLRRVADGFECPSCGNKANWDLTKFNGNVDVQFEPEHEEAGQIAKAKIRATALAAEEILQQTPAYPAHFWAEDEGKKNTSQHKCGKCTQLFFGKKSRKYCRLCQTGINTILRQRTREHQYNPYLEPHPAVNRKERRQR
jgi:Zn finger protein HypA/HybF involved in hydrogenase expression